MANSAFTFAGISGYSGYSSYSGYSGSSGFTGYSGFSGTGISGYTGFSGQQGFSGWTGYSGYSGLNANTQTVIASNTFNPGNVIYRTSGSYALALANALSSADAVGVVQTASTSAFSYVINGYISGLSGLTDSVGYYLSDTTAGLLVSASPVNVGSVIKPMFIAIGTTAGVVVEYPSVLIGTANTGTSGYYAKWNAFNQIGNGLIYDNGTTVIISSLSAGNLSAVNLYTYNEYNVSATNFTATGTTELSGATSVIGTLTVVGNISATGTIRFNKL